jgi:hypothetical protein
MGCNDCIYLSTWKRLYDLMEKAYGHVRVRCSQWVENRRLATLILPQAIQTMDLFRTLKDFSGQ